MIFGSPEDERWKDRLIAHLGVLRQQGILQIYEDRSVPAGENRRTSLRNAIARASVTVLLVTADFLGSDIVEEHEMLCLPGGWNNGDMSIIPVLVKPCAWDAVDWLQHLQVYPPERRFLSAGDEHKIESDLAAITAEIQRRLNSAGHRPEARLTRSCAAAPTPHYPDEATRQLSEQLESARARRADRDGHRSK